MDMMELVLSIYEGVNSGEISQEEGYKAIGLIQEGVFNSPLKKKLDKLKEIKDAKPKEYDGPKEVKDFVDKYYKDIVACAELAEKEPGNIRKAEIHSVVGCITGYVAGFAAFCSSVTVGGTIGIGLLAGGWVGMILAILGSAISTIVLACRSNDDIKATDELAKIRSALKKIDTSKLPKEYKNKIADIITSIDDAETEISSRLKVTKESTDMQLKIYEACMDGKITEAERDKLLNTINNTDMSINEGAISNLLKRNNSDNTEMTKEKYRKLSKSKRIQYHKDRLAKEAKAKNKEFKFHQVNQDTLYYELIDPSTGKGNGVTYTVNLEYM